MSMKTLMAAGLLGLALVAPASAARIVLNNVDAPGIGFNDTTPVWTANDPRIAVRIATRDSGPLDQVGVMFAEVAGENMMRAWRTFRARPDFDKKLGAFVGAMGHEVADLFELRFYRTGEPQLEATFTPSPLPFGKKPITA